MSKVTLTHINSDYASKQAVNANYDTIEAAFDNTLSRDGSTPNSMAANLDMNSNRILNLPVPVSDQEPARKGDLQGFVDAAQAAQTAAESSATASATSASAASASAVAASSSASDSATSASASSSSATASASSATDSATSATASAASATLAASLVNNLNFPVINLNYAGLSTSKTAAQNYSVWSTSMAALPSGGGSFYISTPGTYQLPPDINLTLGNFTVYMEKGVNLSFATVGSSHAAFNIQANNVKFQGGKITGPASGTYVANEYCFYGTGVSSSSRLSGLVIKDLEICNFGAYGARLTFFNNIQLINCVIHDCGYAGFMAFSSDNGYIYNNIIHDITPGTGGNMYGLSLTSLNTNYQLDVNAGRYVSFAINMTNPNRLTSASAASNMNGLKISGPSINQGVTVSSVSVGSYITLSQNLNYSGSPTNIIAFIGDPLLHANPFCNNWVVDSNYIYNNAWQGIDTHGVYNSRFVNNYTYNCKAGISVCGGSNDAAPYSGWNNVVSDNVCDAGPTYAGQGIGINVAGGTTLPQRNVTCTNNQIIRHGLINGSGSNPALLASDIIDSTVSDNVIDRFGGIALFMSGGCSNNTISNNSFGPLLKLDDGYGYCIYSSQLTGNNVFEGNISNANTGAPLVGFRSTSSTGVQYVSGNDFRLTATPWYLQATTDITGPDISATTMNKIVVSGVGGAVTVDLSTANVYQPIIVLFTGLTSNVTSITFSNYQNGTRVLIANEDAGGKTVTFTRSNSRLPGSSDITITRYNNISIYSGYATTEWRCSDYVTTNG